MIAHLLEKSFQDTKLLVEMQGKLNGLIPVFEGIISSSPNDKDYTKLEEMDIGTYPNLPPVVSKP